MCIKQIYTMKQNYYDSLSNSHAYNVCVHSPTNNRYKPQQNNKTQYDSFLRNTSYESWTKSNQANFNDIKKVSNDKMNLRQTFDLGSNARIRNRIAKDEYEYVQEKTLNPNKYISSSTQGYGDVGNRNNERKNSYAENSHHNDGYSRSPNWRQHLEDKFKKYNDTYDMVKGQLETSAKMSEELKKLKEDRQKRREVKQRELSNLEEKLTSSSHKEQEQTFKKKNYYQFYSPKAYKYSYADRLNGNMENSLNLNTYKSRQFQISKSQAASPTINSKSFAETLKSEVQDLMNPEPESCSTQSKNFEEVNGFILGKKLGEGRFGSVFQATHKNTGFIVALKKISKSLIKSNNMVDQFTLELRIQSYIHHQNVLGLYGFFDDSKYIYLILQYMPGGTLFQQLKKLQILKEPKVSKTIREITMALKYLHENYIAHRDIKPQNIVISHGVSKLCDFGWSAICDERRKTYCGTIDYNPPEMLEGQQYDLTVDLWCLGVLTYQLLIGKAPFYHYSRKQTKNKIINVDNADVEYPDTLSQNAVSFISSLLKKNPEQRPSCEDLLNHLFLRQEKKVV